MTECVAHSFRFDEDCDYCKQETVELIARYNKQVDKNNTIELDLHRQGHSVDPSIFIMTKINMLASAMFGENLKGRHRFELAYAQECERLLMEAQQQSARQKLLTGVNGTKIAKR